MLEDHVPDRQRFVHQQDVGVGMNGHGERQAHEHPARVSLDRLINEVADLGEVKDFIQPGLHLRTREAHDGAVHEDVFTAREFGIEA